MLDSTAYAPRRSRKSRSRLWPRTLLVSLAAALVFGGGLSAGGLAVKGPLAAPAATPQYTLQAQALLGPDGTDLYLTPSSSTVPDPAALDKVQLKTSNPAGKQLGTENRFDIPVRDGVATIHLDGLRRLDQIEINAHAKAPDGTSVTPSQNNLAAEAQVRRRPDLTVKVSLPHRITRKHAFTLTATVTEIGGDTGAKATLAVDGTQPGGVTRQVEVTPGGSTTVPVELAFKTAGEHKLTTAVSHAAPGEWTESNNDETDSPVVSMYTADGAISSQHELATKAGIDVLKAGGNAIDAAAAVQWVLNLTQPHLNGIGGGATMLVHLANGGDFAIDARETAPAATTPDMYASNPTGLATSGAVVGVPGTLAGVDLMVRRWGTRSLADSLQPAIKLATDGFKVGIAYPRACRNFPGLASRPGMREICRHADGTFIQAGETITQPQLAATFKLIADRGTDVFYNGDIARAIVDAVSRFAPAGVMKVSDLANFSVDVRDPIFRDYRGVRVVTLPPSTSGGIVLLQALGLVERFPLGSGDEWKFGSLKATNVELEAMRLTLADRAMWMGDDRFYPVPKEGLLSPGYVAMRSALINPGKRIFPVLPGDPIGFQPSAPPVDFPPDPSDPETTHFSVVDRWGNAVAFTTTLQGTWGSGIAVPGYGFVLNNSLFNFNRTPTKDVPPGNPGVNDPGPGKRPLGNTAPVMLFGDGEPLVVSGTPGGEFIPQAMFQVIVDIVDHHMTLDEATRAPRFWLGPSPESRVDFNPGLEAVMAELRKMGYFVGSPFLGSNFLQSVGVDPATVDLRAVPDMRAEDSFPLVLAAQ